MSSQVELGIPVEGTFVGVKAKIPNKVAILGMKISTKIAMVLLGIFALTVIAVIWYWASPSWKVSQQSTKISQSLQG